MSVRVRIPPSPTGLLHIGTARTALYNYLFAEKNKGVMVYRMEDTDRGRSKKEYEDNITEGLTKLGIIGTEGLHAGGDYGPYRQSERTDIYVGYLSELIEKDTAYFCFCSKERLEEMREQQRKDKKPPRYDGACAALNPAESKKRVEGGENAVIRLRVPANQDVSWHDSVRGEIRIHSGELDDFVIARKSDDPLYHLTVTVDDHDMQITHVIRGEDHITNTPKQILIYRAFGWVKPIFAHLPLILNEDKSKLSKRKNKVSVDDFLAEGYLVPALINFLALLGWNTSDEQEIFSMEELVDKFSLDRVHKGGAVFDLKKLDWINGEYIKKAIAENVEKFYNILEPFLKGQIPTDNPKRIQSMIAHPDFEGRFKKLIEIPEELKVFFDPLPDYSAALIAKEKFEITLEMLEKVMTEAMEAIKALNWETGDATKTQELTGAMVTLVEKLKLKNGQVLWPLRVALSGLEKSPNFATLMVFLGKEETLKRLDTAIKKSKHE